MSQRFVKSLMCSKNPLICSDNSDKDQKYAALESDQAQKFGVVEKGNAQKTAAVERVKAQKFAAIEKGKALKSATVKKNKAQKSAAGERDKAKECDVIEIDNDSDIDLNLSDSFISELDSNSKSPKCPKKSKNKIIRRYNSAPKAKIEKVLQKIKAEKISISDASKLFNISKGTLINRIHNKHQKRFGRPNTLTSMEEKKLAEYIKKLCDIGFSLSISDIQVLASYEYGNKLVQKNSRFGKQWSQSFVTRHDLNSLKRSQSTNIFKNLALKEDAYTFLEHVRSLVHRDETAISPDFIFCFEEFHFSGDPQSNQFVDRKNLRYPLQTPAGKSCVSVMFCGNASGAWLPFYIVKKSCENVTTYKIKSANIDISRNATSFVNKSSDVPISTKVDNVNEDSLNSMNEITNLKLGVSKTGWFDSDVFADWFENVFIKTAVKCADRTVLICDNVPRNINSRTVELAKETNVEFVVVPNNLRQWCQPFSGDFTKSLVRNWGNIIENWLEEISTEECLCCEDFSPLIEKLISRLFQDNSDAFLSPEERMASLSDGFEKCGIWPVDPESVMSKIPDCEENDLTYKDFNVEIQNDDFFLLIKY